MATPHFTQLDEDSHDAANSNDNRTLNTCVHNLYEPLDKEKRQIRLFELLPGKKADPLRGRLHTVVLEDNPSFDALSYVWGIVKARFPLTCNENKTLMTPNTLRPVLITLRSEDESLILWIDAICINQDDIRERGHQVTLMQAIYTMAQCVRIWLNTDVDPLSPAFSAASRLDGPVFDFSSAKLVRHRIQDAIQLQDYDMHFWKPLYDVLANEYWERLWTQQELYLARSIRVYTPHGPVCPHTLFKFEFYIGMKSAEVLIGRDVRAGICIPVRQIFKKSLFTSIHSGLHHLRSSSESSEQDNLSECSLLQLYLRSTALKTTDTRDRVYGILGLSRNCGENEIFPNYDLSTFAVYTQVIQHFIEKDRSLNFLCNYGQDYDDSLPSWLPSPEKQSKMLTGLLGISNAAKFAVDSYTTINGRVMSVRAIKCDEVSVTEKSRSIRMAIPDWWNALKNIGIKSGLCQQANEIFLCTQVYQILTFWNFEQQYEDLLKTALPTHNEFWSELRSLVVSAHREGFKTTSIVDSATKNTILSDTNTLRIAHTIVLALRDSSLFGTQGKRIGAIHPSCIRTKAEAGDGVWILLGCKMPMILRPAPADKYKIIGPAVIPGLMQGEACEGLLENGVPRPDYRGPPIVKVDLI